MHAELEPAMAARTLLYAKVWLPAAVAAALLGRKRLTARNLRTAAACTLATYLSAHVDLLAAGHARAREAQRPEIVAERP